MTVRVRNEPRDVWTRVARGAAEECWEWQGARNQKGYGVMRIDGAMVAAHRVAYEASTGESPGALCVLHRCDNPPCCNPAHLFLGTHGDNNRDAASKGRSVRGERHHAAKLTAPKVREIRCLARLGVEGLELAARFGVTPQTISHIVTGKTWRHA